MSGGIWERELKGVLRGDPDVLERVTRSCTPEEREAYFRIQGHPFTVLRAAGSLGIDLVAIRGDVSFPIEVKASKGPTLWLSKRHRTKVQAEDLLAECARSGLLPLYAYRLKNSRGDSWRLFTLDTLRVVGPLQTVQEHVPQARVSKEGNYILRWAEGMPLHRFVALMADGLDGA